MKMLMYLFVLLGLIGCQTTQPKASNPLDEVKTVYLGEHTLPKSSNGFQNLGNGWFIFTFEDGHTGKSHRILALRQNAHSPVLAFTELK